MSGNNRKPVVGVTIGDPAGIGPEIVTRAMTKKEVYKKVNPVVIGSQQVLEREVEQHKLDCKINIIESLEAANFKPEVINIIALENVNMSNLEIGKIQAEAGKAAYEYIKKATEMALSDELDAIATAPINKEAIRAAGIGQKGCTEILGELTEVANPLTMFAVQDLRIFFYTRHLSLRDAISKIEKEKLIDITKQCLSELEKVGIEQGKFALAGLNPHCSDGGLFGDEEQKEIKPAINELQAQGYDVIGPIGADSIFHLANENNWRGVLSLYHDQGHIAAKTLDFYKTVSITLGLPFLRTSVDHGTAFDIAGTGQANPISMIEAIKKVADYV